MAPRSISETIFSDQELASLFSNAEANPDALKRLIPFIYEELRQVAHRHLVGAGRHRVLNTTTLVHEVYLKLAGQGNVRWENRAHFFGIAARAMRCILIDWARHTRTARRGGKQTHLSLDEADIAPEGASETLLALDESLHRLSALDHRKGQIVEYRFFGGLTIQETAVLMNLSPATIKNEWGFAKVWLYSDMSEP